MEKGIMGLSDISEYLLPDKTELNSLPVLFGGKQRESGSSFGQESPAALYVFYISNASKSCHPSVKSDPKFLGYSVSMSSKGPVKLQKTIDSSSEKSQGG